MLSLSNPPAAHKPDSVTSSSGSGPADWREYWRVHGTSWQHIFELHAAIVPRLQAASSSWGTP